jgi:hypothetical protein
LAKKTRTPAPPRKVQAPKRQVQAPKARPGKGSRELRRPSALAYALAGAGIAGIAVVVLIVVLTGGGSSGRPTDQQVLQTAAAAGCRVDTVTPIPNFNPGHTTVPKLSSPVKYNSYPPAAGAHYGIPAVWGFYTTPANPRAVVHNEEHGGVVLWWGPQTPRSTIDKLNAFYSSDPVSMFGTVLPPTKGLTDIKNPRAFQQGLGSKFVVTAWTGDTSRYYVKSAAYPQGYRGVGRIESCTSWRDGTEKALTTFRDAYRGRAPEGVPMSRNQPGT